MERRLIRRTLSVLPVMALCACSTPYSISTDPAVNYRMVFADVPYDETRVVNSRLEIMHKRLLGFPLGDGQGEWEFELLATPVWLSTVRTGFEQVDWPELSRTPIARARIVPTWFHPDPHEYELWRLQPTSYPAVHLFVERAPKDPGRVHVFIRRH